MFSLHCWTDLKTRYPDLGAIWENSQGINTREPFISANDVAITIPSCSEHEEQDEISTQEDSDKEEKEMNFIKKEEEYSEISTLASDRVPLGRNDTVMIVEDQHLDILSGGITEK